MAELIAMRRDCRLHYMQHGMTLWELLVVTSIMGVLFSTAMPQLGRYVDTLRLSEQRLQVMAMLNNVRVEAMRTRRSMDVEFTQNGFTWRVLGGEQNSQGAFELKEGVNWKGETPANFSFNGLGFVRELSAGDTILIGLARGDYAKEIRINRNGFME